jgi:O-antigen ligase
VLARDELVRTVGIFGIYLIAVNSRSEKSSNYFYQSLRLTASLCSFFALYQLINQTGGIYVNGTWRYSGFMHSPNTAAILYAAYLIAECTIFKNSKSRLRIVTIGLSLAGLVLTLSVGGFIFLGLGMSITLGLRNERDRFNKVLVFVVTSTTSLVAAYFLISSVRAKINLSFLPVFSQSADARSSLQWRFDTWRTFVNYWLDKPLFGQGFGSTRNLNMAGKYMPHDEYLRLLVEVGVVGIVIFSVTYLSTLAKILKIQRALKDPLSLYTSAIMIVMLVNAISENTFTYTVPEYILAASIGFALSRSRRLNSNLVKSRNSFEHRINMSGNEAYSFRKLMEK